MLLMMKPQAAGRACVDVVGIEWREEESLDGSGGVVGEGYALRGGCDAADGEDDGVDGEGFVLLAVG